MSNKTLFIAFIFVLFQTRLQGNSGKYKGIAENLAVLDSAYYLAQIFLSIWTGYMVDITGNPTTYMIAAAVFGLVATFSTNFVIFDAKEFHEERNCNIKMLDIAVQN